MKFKKGDKKSPAKKTTLARKRSMRSKARVSIAVACHKPTLIPQASIYTPIQLGAALADELDGSMQADNVGENISQLNPYFAELTAQYWAWKHFNADFIGLCHYRRYFCFDGVDHTLNDHGQIEIDDLTPQAISDYLLDDEVLIANEVRTCDIVIPQTWSVRGVYTPKGPKKTVAKHMIAYGLVTKDVLELLDALVAKRQRAYLKDLRAYLKGSTYIGYNCFIAQRKEFDKLCAFEFDILEAFNNVFDYDALPADKRRICGYLGEILFSAFVLHEQRKRKTVIKEVPLTFFKYTYSKQELDELLAQGPIVHALPPKGFRQRAKERLLPQGSKRYGAVVTVVGLFR